MYSVTSWLGRVGFDDNPTTAIVLHFCSISAIGSAPLFAAKSEPSGTRTFIASQARPLRLVSSAPDPALTSLYHSLPTSPPRFEWPPGIRSTPATAQSLPGTV